MLQSFPSVVAAGWGRWWEVVVCVLRRMLIQSIQSNEFWGRVQSKNSDMEFRVFKVLLGNQPSKKLHVRPAHSPMCATSTSRLHTFATWSFDMEFWHLQTFNTTGTYEELTTSTTAARKKQSTPTTMAMTQQAYYWYKQPELSSTKECCKSSRQCYGSEVTAESRKDCICWTKEMSTGRSHQIWSSSQWALVVSAFSVTDKATAVPTVVIKNLDAIDATLRSLLLF